MTERQAAMTSMREFELRMAGYREQQQVEWERARWTAFSIFSPFIKNGPKTPDAWVRFPWEKPKVAKVVKIDDESIYKLNNIYTDFMSRKNNKLS